MEGQMLGQSGSFLITQRTTWSSTKNKLVGAATMFMSKPMTRVHDHAHANAVSCSTPFGTNREARAIGD